MSLMKIFLLLKILLILKYKLHYNKTTYYEVILICVICYGIYCVVPK